MAKAGGIRAGKAYVELFADDSKLVRGLRNAQRKLAAFGASVTAAGMKIAALGAAAAAPFVASVRHFSRAGDAIAKMSKRTGLTVEALSELQFVASQSGSDIDSLEKGIRRMQQSIYDAGRGLSTATEALRDLNLTAADLAGKSPEQQFKLMAEQISKVEDPSKRAALAIALFGRSGTQLLPMFAQGAKGIEALQARARALGLTMSGEDAAAAETLTDAMDKLWQSVKMGAFRVGAALAPALTELAEKFTAATVVAGRWLSRNKEFIIGAAKLAAKMLIVGVAMIAVGKLIGAVSVIMKAGIAIMAAYAVVKMFATQHPIAALAAVVAMGVAVGATVSYIQGKMRELSREMGAAEKAFRRAEDAAEAAGRSATGGGPGGGGAEEGTAGEVARAETLKGMYEKLAEIEKRIARERMTQHERRMDELKDQREEVKKLITVMGNLKDPREWQPLLDKWAELDQAILALGQRARNEKATSEAADAFDAAFARSEEAVRARAAETGESEELTALRIRFEKARGKTPDVPLTMGFEEFVKLTTEGGKKLLEATAAGISAGTFNAAAVQSLQMRSNTAADRTAKATELTAVNTKKIIEEIRNGGLAFD